MAATSQIKEKFYDYEGFVEKFKPKKTTDDCYTPVEIYEVIKDYFVKELHLEGKEIIRPFYPGGDYENFNYPENCVVLDNPPFSILSKIKDFYLKNNIDFILFAPHLTSFGSCRNTCVIVTDSNIKYQNGAIIPTDFCTNLKEEPIWLNGEIQELIRKVQKNEKKKINKRNFPENVISSARLGKYIKEGVNILIPKESCTFIREVDGIKIFGGGFIIDEQTTKKLKELMTH